VPAWEKLKRISSSVASLERFPTYSFLFMFVSFLSSVFLRIFQPQGTGPLQCKRHRRNHSEDSARALPRIHGAKVPPEYRVGLERPDILGRGAFLALLDFEAHALALLKGPEAAVLDRAEVHEDVIAFVGLDETEALALIEPFNFTF
jgi:hypothetical protein